MDGSETVGFTQGVRIYARPGAKEPEKADDRGAILQKLGAKNPAAPSSRDRPRRRVCQTARGPFFDRRAARSRRARCDARPSSGKRARFVRWAAMHLSQKSSAPHFQSRKGPMTRVSDRAPFAEAVARAGCAAFSRALAHARRRGARSSSKKRATRVEGRPWGVGILGFVPPELQQEQLALIAEMKPTVALIAGGRPSQARPLEKEGIRTFLARSVAGAPRPISERGRS